MTVDRAGFEEKMLQLKNDFRKQQMTTLNGIEALEQLLSTVTANDIKYDYTYDGNRNLYRIKPVKSKILSIVDENGSIMTTAEATSTSAQIILEKSPFYYESGGQESDRGIISKNGKTFQLKSLSSRKNCVFHEIELSKDEPLQVGDLIDLEVDEERRTATTRNHSATHLLNSAVREVTRYPIYQKSSLVTADCLKIELSCLGPKLGHRDLQPIEELVRQYIKQQPLPRKIRILNSQDLQNESDVVMIPGEVYPDEGIRLVTFGNFSKELCCGTHVLNTKELVEFTFLSMRSTGRNSYYFSATTGPIAVNAIEIGEQMLTELSSIKENLTADNALELLSHVREISKLLNNSNIAVSFIKKLECQAMTLEIKHKMKQESMKILDSEMKNVLKETSKSPFVVHFLICSDVLKSVSLEKATRFVKDRPVLIITSSEDNIKARCCVPAHLVTENFNAEIWLNEFAKVFKARLAPPKGQNPKETCLMKEKYVKPDVFEELLDEATSAAEIFASQYK